MITYTGKHDVKTAMRILVNEMQSTEIPAFQQSKIDYSIAGIYGDTESRWHFWIHPLNGGCVYRIDSRQLVAAVKLNRDRNFPLIVLKPSVMKDDRTFYALARQVILDKDERLTDFAKRSTMKVY